MGFFKKKINKETLLQDFLNNISIDPTVFEEMCQDFTNNTLQSNITITGGKIDFAIDFIWMDEKAVKASNDDFVKDGRDKEFLSVYYHTVGPFISIEASYQDLIIDFFLCERFYESGLWFGEKENHQLVESFQEMSNFTTTKEVYELMRNVMISHFNL